MTQYFILFGLIILISEQVSGQISWQAGNWAFNCDFPGGDLSNAQIPGDQCGSRCASTSGCTHFTWTNYNGGI